MIKLVLYTENYFPGGLERFVFDIIESKKFDIYMIVNDENDRIIKFAIRNNLKYRAIKLTRIKIDDLGSFSIVKKMIKVFNFLASYFTIIPNYFRIQKVLISLKNYENFLIINGGYPAALSCFSAAIASRKIGFSRVGMSILSSPSSNYSNGIFRFFQSKIDSFIDKFVDFYIPNSNEIRLQLIKKVNFKPEKINVIYTGVVIPSNTEKITTLMLNNMKINKNTNEFWIVMVGLLGSTKRQDLLLSVIEKLDQHSRLLLVGDGPNRTMLEEMVHKLKIESKVFFAGWLNPIDDVYRFADVLVFLSNQEGLPYVVSEAMSYKLPVIASAVGGIPEQIEDNLGGILVLNDDVNKIVEKINYLKDNVEVRSNYSSYSYERLKQVFSLDAMYKEFYKLYK